MKAYGRSVAVALFAFFLTVFLFAHADTTPTAAQILLQSLTPPTTFIPYNNPDVASTSPTGALQGSRAASVPIGVSLPNLLPLNASLVPQEAIVPDASSAATTPMTGTAPTNVSTSTATLIQSLYAEVKTFEAEIAALEAMSSPSSCAPLSLARPLAIGSKGADVTTLQEYLVAAGYLHTAPSGYYGSLTSSAVAAFQKDNGIPILGNVGPLTRAKITALTMCSSSGSSSRTPLNATSTATSIATTPPLFPITPGYGGGGESGIGNNTPPVITSISSSPDGTTATITWTTDQLSDSHVDYGITSSYGTATTSATLTTSHSITIISLATSTAYHFRVQSTDSSGNTASSNDQLFTTSNTITKNIITDFGAKGDGVTDDGPAFGVFQTWALAQGNVQIDLTLPAGHIFCFNSLSDPNWTVGIKNLKLSGYGATLSDCGSGISPPFLAGKGIVQDNVTNALIATVLAGSNTVTLLTPSQYSRFAVGNWVVITAVDLQGASGYPPNPAIFEYAQISSINPGTGVITLTAPLQYSYKSTYPSYAPSATWVGGPATIYALPSSWDATFEYDGVKIDFAQQSYADGRSVTFRDVTWTGTACTVPTPKFELDCDQRDNDQLRHGGR